ncbi:unnamed protein product [Arctogadus glacialis]
MKSVRYQVSTYACRVLTVGNSPHCFRRSSPRTCGSALCRTKASCSRAQALPLSLSVGESRRERQQKQTRASGSETHSPTHHKTTRDNNNKRRNQRNHNITPNSRSQ